MTITEIQIKQELQFRTLAAAVFFDLKSRFTVKELIEIVQKIVPSIEVKRADKKSCRGVYYALHNDNDFTTYLGSSAGEAINYLAGLIAGNHPANILARLAEDSEDVSIAAFNRIATDLMSTKEIAANIEVLSGIVAKAGNQLRIEKLENE